MGIDHHIVTVIETEECYKCGIIFGLPKDFIRRARETGSSFWCPNGHSQCYTKPEVQRLKDQLAAAARRQEYTQAELESNIERANRAERSAIAYKGQVTRVKNRVGKGVCPCCNRTFQDLARHMETKHPNYGSVES